MQLEHEHELMGDIGLEIIEAIDGTCILSAGKFGGRGNLVLASVMPEVHLLSGSPELESFLCKLSLSSDSVSLLIPFNASFPGIVDRMDTIIFNPNDQHT